ncbi:PREDICTED: kinesin-like protein KIF18A [Dinoponera quadriceps]|uniref:Kinesin-like protein KIF18A n=1 Tax=Dinoponera quadriceps TaxID=609295 RepID=A0A6P3XH87_DINQU|nr:PREDICTED: kinesin-like protein KIF18A [Dinoponera quadriceps]
MKTTISQSATMVFGRKDTTKTSSPNRAKRTQISGSEPNMGSDAQTDVSEISIKVIVRVRPHNERELQDNSRTIIETVDDKMLIFDPNEKETPFFFHNVAQRGRDMLKKQNKHLQFIFDRIFNETSRNKDVFESSTKSLISNLLDGYNCSVFAYGATGAGKTHTMLGNKDDPGITYLTVAELFSEIERQSNYREFNLNVTYLEIYNENVQDLLHKSGPLHLREDGRRGVVVARLKPIAIKSAQELLSLLAEGNKNRTQHPTDANKESSRSHAVFQVYIEIVNKLDSQVQRVKLSMIDLAGSERASATGCKGVRFKEGANINKSLLALGNCINNLADGIKHIPYRDSKLTRLLKDSLGGNCHTVMIANIGPSSFTYEDTYNTLRYANRTKKIKSYAKKNVSCETHIAGYIKIVEEQKKEIAALKSRLAALESVPAAPSPQPDKFMLEVYRKLSKSYDKKKELIEKMLALESSDKILACRMLYKRDADERLHYLTAADDALPSEELNASGKSRVNKSLHYFQRQRDSLKTQTEAAWQELCSVEAEIQRLRDAPLSEDLRNKLSLQMCEIERCWISGMRQHMRKLCSLQQCERQSVNTISRMMSMNLQNYYNMVKGYGTMTEKMQAEFKELVKLLEGFRSIKWSDAAMDTDAGDFGIFACLSTIGTFDNAAGLLKEEEQRDVRSASNILNATFNAENSSDESSESGAMGDKRLVATSNLRERKGSAIRKRALSDKNQESTPAKQTKKLYNGKTIVGGRADKENVQRRLPVHMSAKSIAILNKLKNTTAQSDNEALKTVRNKERRALITTHPYQKPASGRKHNPAPPSTRVPW